MPVLKIVTINILFDLSRWKERRGLLVQGLSKLKPDVVAIQEVRLPDNPSSWLAEQLNYPYVSLCPKTGYEKNKEAIAILSRLPFETEARLDLGGQRRVAQVVKVRVDGQPLLLANTHLFWQPGESANRLRQVEGLLEWLKSIPGSLACVVCGDFNATPETKAIQRMRSEFASAYAAVHGSEPEYTCPTPLPRALWPTLRTLLGFFLLIRLKQIDLQWRGTLDYIFTSPEMKVLDCQVVLDQPAPDNPKIYPSDHYGLCATIEVNAG
jgi:endonuclease/exonuclease/phosphatase family metal-dependent hydrolase